MPLPIVTLDKVKQLAKTLSPKVVTEFGMLIDARFKQALNA